jgi:hypothetical protein
MLKNGLIEKITVGEAAALFLRSIPTGSFIFREGQQRMKTIEILSIDFLNDLLLI